MQAKLNVEAFDWSIEDDQHWRAEAQENLETWESSIKEISDQAPANDQTPSHDCPTPDNELFRASPVSVRQNPKLQEQAMCGTVSLGQTKDDEPNLDNVKVERTSQGSPAPTRDSPKSQRNSEQCHQGTNSSDAEREKQQTRAFCTPKCLLGLVNGGDLDHGCPNVDEHGTSEHRIDKLAFLALMHPQLSRTLDSDFEPCGLPGSSSLPFRATLASHGYTVIVKCTTFALEACLRHESSIYERLSTLQGSCVPVHLGNVTLDHPYHYRCAELYHVMFLGYGGSRIDEHWKDLEQQSALDQVVSCLRSIHELGVLHQDIFPRNVLWECDSGRVTVIDFDGSRMSSSRAELDSPSDDHNRKVQDGGSHGGKSTKIPKRLFARELEEVKKNFRRLE